MSALKNTVRPGLALIIDSEQAELLRLGGEVILGALNARIARADPDRIISASHELQRIKLHNLLEQLQDRRILPLAALPKIARGQLDYAVKTLAGPKNDLAQEEAWTLLVNTIWSFALQKVEPQT